MEIITPKILLPQLFLCWIHICCNLYQPAEKTIKSFFQDDFNQPGWSSPDWSKAIIYNGKKVGSENRFFVLSRWNKDSLCFFFKVEDSCLMSFQHEKDHPQLFLDDMVEVLIDPHNKKDSCWAEDDIVYHVNLLGIKKDDRGTHNCITNPLWDGKASISVQLFGSLNNHTDIDKGYLISLIVPWTELDLQASSGLSLGINFANGDNDCKGRQLFDWVGAWPMRSPYAFGILTLVEQKK